MKDASDFEEIEVAMDVVELETPEGLKYLALEKSDEYQQNRKRYEENPLEVPGGKLEEGESAVEAAKRELREETGIEAVEEVSEAQSYTDRQEEVEISFNPVLLSVDVDQDSVSLHPEEHQDYLWLSRQEFLEHEDLTENDKEALRRVEDQSR